MNQDEFYVFSGGINKTLFGSILLKIEILMGERVLLIIAESQI